MVKPPDQDRVPLGPPINNVHIYVVDEHLSLVPLGAPGEIVFSGVCVGRGYINDPERTQLAYMADPLREGKRLYRSGDFGRWQPDGKLEFLGRRDAQIKIRGFRIEIGDIENALLRVPDIRQGAVVVIEQADRGKYLVAFYSGQRPLDVNDIQNQISQSLPAYMIPSTFHWLENLPLTANSKIDRRKLRILAGELDTVEERYQPPYTPTERHLATVWAKVLGIPENRIGRQDHFFDLGGTSLTAVRLVIVMDRAVSLKDVTQYPILTDLAGLVDGRTQRHSELLQLLSKPDSVKAKALVCFPYAGGNAVNFQSMASILASNGIAVYAVELPGHDLTAESEQFIPLPQVVDQVVDEIIRLGLRHILLWGHSSGTAFAVETAKKLRARNIDVQRVFLAAHLLGQVADRRTEIDELIGRSNAEIFTELSGDNSYTEFGEMDALHTEHIGAAYRHDYLCAHNYFVDTLVNPPSEKLSMPITVVVAADDPFTAEYTHQYRSWQLLAERVDLFELADGGHYFLRTRPSEAAYAVINEIAPLSA
jgi:surfactin synthase thioesterase subunit